MTALFRIRLALAFSLTAIHQSASFLPSCTSSSSRIVLSSRPSSNPRTTTTDANPGDDNRRFTPEPYGIHSAAARSWQLYSSPQENNSSEDWRGPRWWVSVALGLTLLAATTSTSTSFGAPSACWAADATLSDLKKYDGFAEYAKENKMEQSDVGCFMQQCGDQTKALFSNPRGIKGVSCLGRCKGEQACATRCFAEFSSDALNDWLSCTIEENECVKVPKSTIDNSAENIGYSTVVQRFDPSSLVGSWYKTDGLNPNYDLFDCQTNTFTKASDRELDMGIFFRVRRPAESGGGFWENQLTEHMVVDRPVLTAAAGDGGIQAANAADTNDMDAAGRTMHTSGKMYGLQFSENWYILGESDGTGSVPPFKLVAYKGHTLQGNYEGAFVYAKSPQLPEAAKPAVRAAAAKAGLDFDDFTVIDNTCLPGESLNDSAAGTGTSTTDWIDLVVGEGGVIDWISPGWRGEYKQIAKR